MDETQLKKWWQPGGGVYGSRILELIEGFRDLWSLITKRRKQCS